MKHLHVFGHHGSVMDNIRKQTGGGLPIKHAAMNAIKKDNKPGDKAKRRRRASEMARKYPLHSKGGRYFPGAIP